MPFFFSRPAALLPAAASPLALASDAAPGMSPTHDIVTVSGIARHSPPDGLWDSHALRGVTGAPKCGSDHLLNGCRSSRGDNGMRHAGHTQNVEVLTGPAQALYGRLGAVPVPRFPGAPTNHQHRPGK